jgi:hypothetical protein
MPLIAISKQTYERQGLYRARLVNMYVEQTPEGPTPYALRQRPALSSYATVGIGPIRALLTHDGYQYAVSGTRVYRRLLASSTWTQVGIIAGADRVRHAASDTELVLLAGGVTYLTGSTVTAFAMPDDDYVLDIGLAAGRFIYLVQGGGGKYRYSEVGDATNIPGLNFATAESDPDEGVAVETLGNDVVFFGAKTTEWAGATTSITAPFQPYTGRRYDVGCAAQNSVVKIDNGILWIGTAQSTDRTDLKVYRTGSVAQVISTPAIDALLLQCEDISQATAIEVPTEGRSFYVLNIPGVKSVAYDLKEGLWAEWASYEQETFRLQVADAGIYGDASSGALWTLGEGNKDGTSPMVRLFSAYIQAIDRRRLTSLELFSARGEVTPDPDPVVEMRSTDNEDQGWGIWRSAPIGPTGTAARARWMQLGQIKPPGRALEFRCSDDVMFAPYGLSVGENG